MPQELHNGKLLWRWVCQAENCYDGGVREFDNCVKHGGNHKKNKNGEWF